LGGHRESPVGSRREGSWSGAGRRDPPFSGSTRRDFRGVGTDRESAWERFKESTQATYKLHEIPFPREYELRDVFQHLGGGKKAFQKLAMRWHPDKFTQRFGARLDESQRNDIMQAMNESWIVIQRAFQDGLVP